MASRRRAANSRPEKNSGFSLTELMVAVAIGMFVAIGLFGVLSSASAGRRSSDRSLEVESNGRYALEAIKRDLIHAGYRGITWGAPSSESLGTITSECATGFVANFGQAVWGSNDANPFSATCVPTANYGGGDMLVVRRVSLDPVTTLSANTIYYRSAYERGVVFRGTTAPAFTEVPFQDFRVETIVYFISPYTNSPGESPRVPSLYRVSLAPGGTMATAELVATGVENLQLRFARQTTDGETRYYDANAVSATANSTTTDPNEWDDVNSVRVWLLVRSTTPEPEYTDSSTYSMGDRNVTVNDGFRRQVLSTVVQLRNRL